MHRSKLSVNVSRVNGGEGLTGFLQPLTQKLFVTASHLFKLKYLKLRLFKHSTLLFLII